MFFFFGLCPVLSQRSWDVLLSRNPGSFLLSRRQRRLLAHCVLRAVQLVADLPDTFLALAELLSCGDTTAICETARDS